MAWPQNISRAISARPAFEREKTNCEGCLVREDVDRLFDIYTRDPAAVAVQVVAFPTGCSKN